MGARVSAECIKALALLKKGGITPYAAALKYGLSPSTLYRALNNKEKKKVKK